MLLAWLLAQEFAIPLEKLSEEDAAAVRHVMEKVTLTVDLEPTDVESSLEVYEFCMEQLPFTGQLAGVLTKARYDISRESDVTKERPVTERMKRTFLVLDGEGMSLKLTRVHHEGGRWVYVSRGRYDADLLEVYSRAVIVVEARQEEGRLRTTARVHMRMDEGLGATLTELFSDSVREAVKKKSGVFIEAAQSVTEAVRKDPARVARLARLAERIDATVLDEFQRKFLKR